MTLWKVNKYYTSDDTIKYAATSYDLKGHLKCCWKWYGFKGLKWCYLFKYQAKRKARKLNEVENKWKQ